MKKRSFFLIIMLFAAVLSLSACSVEKTENEAKPEAVISDTEIKEEHYQHATFYMSETDEEVEAQNVEIDISEDSDFNLYGFPVGEQPYFIYVEKGSHSLTIFKKDVYGFYTVEVGCWPTGIGKTKSLTPTGTFTISKKEKWHLWPSGNYSPYATKYYSQKKFGGLYIHSAVYSGKNFKRPFGNSVRGIGKDSTSGCLRTTVQCAYFIYNYCGSGTMVKIVNGSPLGKKAPGVILSTQRTDPASSGVGVQIPDPIELTDISFEKERYTVPAGTTLKVKPEFYPENSAYTSCVWTSSDESVAKVENGTVTGIKPGTARITATYTLNGSINASFIVKVQVGSAVVTETDIIVKLPDPYVPAEENPMEFTSSMIAMDYSGTKIEINKPAEPIVAKLGSDYEYEEAESCAYNGMDKKYVYTRPDGYIEFSTIPLLAGDDAVCEVYITTKEISTLGGIRVGDNVHDIEKVYGTDFTCETISDYGVEDCYMLLTYWAGEKDAPTTPQMSFTLDPNTLEITAICIYSARNFG